MKEAKRIRKLFEDLYNGTPWIDVTLTGILEKITALQASKKTHPWNSIWEIVNHMISWRENVLKRVQETVITPSVHNYFLPVKSIAEKDWKDTLKRLEDSRQEWNLFLSKFSEADFEKIYPNNNLTYYEHMHGILQHDAYHLGQIVLLMKIADT